ncbi:hypothetical protein MCAP1_001179 [Malassezia caprae]|uniref:Uncharacterized protein n=1 Tax=Malassezia caprae TaxID=1381934 RepID=A0AAF0IUS3_9BASI|nr:hypothetical protein MCAP1_001179 [Malassezia caprae]
MSTGTSGGEATPHATLPSSQEPHEPSNSPNMDMSMDPATWEGDASIVKATKNQDASTLASLSFTGPSTKTFSMGASPLPTKSTEQRPRSATLTAVPASGSSSSQAEQALPTLPNTRAPETPTHTPDPSAKPPSPPTSPSRKGAQATEPREPAPDTSSGARPSQKGNEDAGQASAQEDDTDGEESEGDTPDEEPTDDVDRDDATEEPQEAEATEESNMETPEGAGSQGAKSRKRPRSPSPFDPYTSQPPPRPTLRLQFSLTHTPKHKSDYIFRIPRLAVDQLSETYPEWTSWYRAMYLDSDMAKTSREVGLSAEELHDLGGLAKLLHKYPTQGPATHLSRKRRIDEYDVGSYDTKDPFVDDSELGVDEPTHVVRTQADGFYVAKGPVALACAKASTMESSRSASAFRSSLGAGVGQGWAAGTNKLLAKRAASRKLQQPGQASRTDPVPSTASDAQPTLPPADTPSPAAAATPAPPTAPPAQDAAPATPAPDKPDAKKQAADEKRKNKYPTVPVHPQLQAMFDHLKQLVSKASFAVKTKFPPELKPPLIETAKLAVELDEYNDNFFNYLPSIFPYNRFTMMKLTKREFFHKHMEYFRELQDEHLDRLGKMIDESFPTQLAEYEAMCRERGVEGKDNEDGGMDEDGETAADDARLQPEADDMTKRFRWSDDMRDELFTIVTVENAMSEIRNEKLKLENSPETYSEINARKTVYKRIADMFPQDGWVNTTHVSREYGLIRKKRDREEAMELEHSY